MLPISFTQTKFLNPLNMIKAFIWFFLRGFQLNNKKKYEKIVIKNFDKSEFLNLIIPNDIEVVSKVEDDTLILLSKFKPYLFLKYIFSLKKIRLLDKNFFLSSEASTRFRLNYYDFSSLQEREEYINISNKNFESLKKFKNFDSIALLGTGPSYDLARSHYQNRNLEIVACNSGIYDDQLWDVGCKIFCFADPVFHFGSSPEAHRFKNAVLKRFNNEKFFIICPIVAFPILVHDWKIDKRFIIGFQPSGNNYKIGSNKNLLSPNTSNVLTEFMLPIASLLAKNIYLGGFDGREKNETNFWKYSKKTIQTLDEHKDNHPSFFYDRSIKKYYRTHISILRKQIHALEKKGYVIGNITNSNIEILKERIINE
tara:strand:+ start:11391 stop:12497 length:1107 start_codon:yes stop_codon:yes gene_type:complete